MACPLALFTRNTSRPRAWLKKYVQAQKLAAELGLPVFVTMPNIRRLIDELNSTKDLKRECDYF